MTGSRGSRPEKTAVRLDGTLADVVKASVRDAILAGLHQPGEKLSLSTLALAHGVSPTVMRVALAALASEGLVTAEAMVGYRVAPTTITDLDELVELFKANMAIAIRRGVAVGGPSWEARIVAALHVLKRAGREIGGEQPATEVERAHTAFLEAIASGCGNTRLIALLTALWRSLRLYQRLTIGLLKRDTLKRAAGCGEVARAAVKGDADAAVAVMNCNIDSAVTACRAYLAAADDEGSKGDRSIRRRRATG